MNPTSETLTPPEGFRQLGPEEVLEEGDLRVYRHPEEGVKSFETLDPGRKVGSQPTENRHPFIYVRKI